MRTKATRAQMTPFFAFAFFCSGVSPSKEFQDGFLDMAVLLFDSVFASVLHEIADRKE